MSKTNAFETDLLELIFNATTLDDIAENDTSSPATNLYVSLHTGDPGEAGDQTTNECAYTSYARVAVARTGGGWTVASGSVSPAAAVTFPAATGGSETATHFGIGTDATLAGYLMYKGSISPTIAISSGVTPQLTTATAVTED